MIANENNQNNQAATSSENTTLYHFSERIRNGIEGKQRPLYIVESEDSETSRTLFNDGVTNIYFLETIYKELQTLDTLFFTKDRENKPSDSPVIIVTKDTQKYFKEYQYITKRLKESNVDVYLQDGNYTIKGITLGDKDKVETDLRNQYRLIHSATNLTEFEENLERTNNAPPTPTQYKTLDLNFDGGIFEGIYVLGGDTGLGKTTLALNLAENFSSQGRDVLYFSLEVSKNSLTAKMISQQTYILTQRGEGNPQTIRYLTNGSLYNSISPSDLKVVDQAKQLYQAKTKNLYIFESIGNLTVEDIENALERHLVYNKSSQPPIMIIDYLQILRHKDKYIQGNDKLKTDTNLFMLKKLANKYHLPVILLSSLNREGYKVIKPVSLLDFKDTGAIEYTADVVLGLQLDYVCTEPKPTPEDRDLEDSKTPKRVRLTILKNRDGKKRGYSVFEYEPRYHNFKEVRSTNTENRPRYNFE